MLEKKIAGQPPPRAFIENCALAGFSPETIVGKLQRDYGMKVEEAELQVIEYAHSLLDVWSTEAGMVVTLEACKNRLQLEMNSAASSSDRITAATALARIVMKATQLLQEQIGKLNKAKIELMEARADITRQASAALGTQTQDVRVVRRDFEELREGLTVEAEFTESPTDNPTDNSTDSDNNEIQEN